MRCFYQFYGYLGVSRWQCDHKRGASHLGQEQCTQLHTPARAPYVQIRDSVVHRMRLGNT